MACSLLYFELIILYVTYDKRTMVEIGDECKFLFALVGLGIAKVSFHRWNHFFLLYRGHQKGVPIRDFFVTHFFCVTHIQT